MGIVSRENDGLGSIFSCVLLSDGYANAPVDQENAGSCEGIGVKEKVRGGAIPGVKGRFTPVPWSGTHDGAPSKETGQWVPPQRP